MARMKTTEQFKIDIKNRTGSEYKLLSDYTGSQVKVTMLHTTCGNEYLVTPNVFLNGKRCPRCRGGVSYSHDDFLKKFHGEKGSEEFEVLGTYTNNHTKLDFKHLKCGNIISMRPRNFFMGDRCMHCSGLRKKTTNDFKQDVAKLTDDYQVTGTYLNNKRKILMKHLTCGNEDFYYPKDFIYKGTRCKFCRKSIGEEVVAKFLDDNGIEYQWHFKHADCKFKRVLEFDFMIPLMDETYLLIEYNGELHYKPWKQGEKHQKHLEKQQLRDSVKQKFCEENDIELIVISYHDKLNITKILSERLL